jgi:N-methylhydantoinase A
MARVEGHGMNAFVAAFHTAHVQEYGYTVRERAVEIVNCRLQAVGRVQKAPLREIDRKEIPAAAKSGSRSIYYGAEHGWVETAVYDRTRLSAGATLTGPAVIEEMSSTTLLKPAQSATIDRIGNIVIDIRQSVRDHA